MILFPAVAWIFWFSIKVALQYSRTYEAVASHICWHLIIAVRGVDLALLLTSVDGICLSVIQVLFCLLVVIVIVTVVGGIQKRRMTQIGGFTFVVDVSLPCHGGSYAVCCCSFLLFVRRS